MKQTDIQRILNETAYIRTGGTQEELSCAHYIQNECRAFGGEAKLEAFDVDMATIQNAVLLADGKNIPCKGYFNAGSAEIEAPFYYVFTEGENLSLIEREIILNPEIKAPLVTGDVVGEYCYKLNGKELGSVAIVCTEDVKEMTFGAGFMRCKDIFFRETK